MIYHYGRNWKVPADGEYTLKVHIEPPTFMRHDEINGCRFTKPVDAEFTASRSSAGRTEPAAAPALSASTYAAIPVIAAASSTDGQAPSAVGDDVRRTNAPT